MSGTQSFGLSATLQIQGNYQTVLRQLGSTLRGLNKQMTGLETRLNDLLRAFPKFTAVAAASVKPVTSDIAALRAGMAGVSTATQGATRSMSSQASALNRTAQAARSVTQEAQSAAAALRAMGSVHIPRIGRGGGALAAAGGAAGAGAGAAGGAHTPLWRQMLNTGAMGAAGAVGLVSPGAVFGAGAGYAAFAAGREVVRGGGKLQQESAVGRAQVNDPLWLQQLRERSFATANEVPGTTPAENIRAGLELRTAVPDAEQALKLLTPLQGITQALRTLEPGSARAERVAGDLGRALNLRGAAGSQTDAGQMDYVRLQREAEAMGRNMIAFRNMDPREWVNYFQQSRAAGQQATENQLYGGFTASGIQAMGGMRFGTGQAAFVRQFANGVMTDRQAKFLKRLGIISPNAKAAKVTDAEIDAEVASGSLTPDEASELRAGHAQRFAQRDMFRADLAMSNQEAYREALLKMLKSKGIDINSPRALDAFSQQAGGTATARGYLSWLLDALGRKADIQAVQNMPPDALQRLREGYNAGMGSMTAGFETLLQRIGESSEVVKVMNDIGNAFRWLADGVKGGGLDNFFVEGRQRWTTTVREFTAIADFIGPELRARWDTTVKEFTGIMDFVRIDIDKVRAVFAQIPGTAAMVRDALASFVDTLVALPGRILDGARKLLSPGALAPAPGTPNAAPNPDAVPIPPSWGGPMPGAQRSSIIPQSFTPYPAGGGDVTIRIPVIMDGREITEMVTTRQARALNGPVASPGQVDRRRGMLGGEVVTT